MIIYKVTNLKNHKVYIGKTTQELKKRKWNHYDIAYNQDSQTNFHRALRLYDKNVFEWETLLEVDNLDTLNKMEVRFIKKYDSFKNGYNMTEGGDGGFTYKKGTELYERIKHKLGKWENGNPGSSPIAITKRLQTFKNTTWRSGKEHGNHGHSHNKGILMGERNPMFGKVPKNARKVEINGKIYESIRSAYTNTGISMSTIRKRCLDINNNEYKYIN